MLRFHTRKAVRALAILSTLLCFSAPAAASDGSQHPLDPLTAREYRTISRVLTKAGHLGEDTLLPLVQLREPEKEAILAWRPGDKLWRRAFVVVKQGRTTHEAVIDLDADRLVSWTEVEGVQSGILLTEEWAAAKQAVQAHGPWREAIARRGIEDTDSVVPVPLTTGFFGNDDQRSRRLVRVVSYDGRETDNFWARPIEGLIALVDLDRREVVELHDTGVVPIPGGEADLDPEAVGELRQAPNPVRLQQPEGPSYELDGHLVRWQKWSFHWRVDPRVGPVISLVGYRDGQKNRSILFQGSLSEMYVPYTDPSAAWYFRAFMDAGEYGIGKLLAPLRAGVDCPSHATFFSPLLADDWGNAYAIGNAVCLFERSVGDLAWRHHEAVSGKTESRRATELVLRAVPAVGNYDYVLDWVFRQNGSIVISVGSTGIPLVKAVASRKVSDADADDAYGRLIAPNRVAVNHDHYFCFRLDLDVDGRDNTLQIDRLKTKRPKEPTRTSTWILDSKPATTEQDAKLRIVLERPALWRVINPAKRGPTGYPVSYHLQPRANTNSLFATDDIVQQRAGFTNYHLWVTPYAPEERYAAGAYPNQSPGGNGLPHWTTHDRPIKNTDIVLWYTLGMHHVVRAEDWPVLPTTHHSFELRPFDFFPKNPALDLPRPK